jgi:hypothetical protein
MKKQECPAWGKTCAKCGMANHFKGAPKCPKSKTNAAYFIEEHHKRISKQHR